MLILLASLAFLPDSRFMTTGFVERALGVEWWITCQGQALLLFVAMDLLPSTDRRLQGPEAVAPESLALGHC